MTGTRLNKRATKYASTRVSATKTTPKTFPFGQGWGMGTVNPKIYEDWDPNDLRRDASVLDARNTDEVADFDFGGGNQQDLTCYWQKKYIPINVWTDETKNRRI